MAYRLGDYVVYGELWNTSRYSTRGAMILRSDSPDGETIVHVELTGDPASDLRGKHVRFRPGENDTGGAVFCVSENRGFQDRQIGPTGDMSAQGWVRTLPCSVAEFMRRVDLGEPPPTEWKRRLYLEWHSQNGRVVVEMADPVVEECTRESRGQGDEGEWALLPNLAAPPQLAGDQPTTGPEITLVQLDENGPRIENLSPPPGAGWDEDDVLSSLVLQRQLDAEAAAIDQAIRGEDGPSDDEIIREAELMDSCMEEGRGTPLTSFMGDISALPRPEDLDDAAVECWLKVILARLALIHVALDVCEHFTPRDCYALLLDEILKDESAHGGLVGTGWVTHFMTHEYCAECDAACEKEFLASQNPDAS